MSGRFSCIKCGNCCKSDLVEVKAKIAPSEEKGPLYKNHGAIGLPVLDFQKAELEEEAKKLGIKASFVPEKYFFDALTKTMVVATWKLEGTPCPFLSEEKMCRVYSKRPFVCRRFPLLVQGNKIVCSSNCEAVSQDDLKDIRSKEDFESFFPKQVLALKEGKEAIRQINNVLGRLPSTGKVFLVKGLTQKELPKKFPKHETIGLFKFLKRNGIGSQNLAIEIKKALKNA